MQPWSPFASDETLPAFDFTWRGYARSQVDEHLERFHDRLQECASHYETALEQMAGELSQVRHDNTRLKSALAAPADEPAAVAARVELILSAARNEAAEIVRRAGETLERAEQDALAARRDFEAALADRRRREFEAEAILLGAGRTLASDPAAKARNGRKRTSTNA